MVHGEVQSGGVGASRLSNPSVCSRVSVIAPHHPLCLSVVGKEKESLMRGSYTVVGNRNRNRNIRIGISVVGRIPY